MQWPSFRTFPSRDDRTADRPADAEAIASGCHRRSLTSRRGAAIGRDHPRVVASPDHGGAKLQSFPVGRRSPTLEDRTLRAVVQLEPDDQRFVLVVSFAVGLGVEPGRSPRPRACERAARTRGPDDGPASGTGRWSRPGTPSIRCPRAPETAVRVCGKIVSSVREGSWVILQFPFHVVLFAVWSPCPGLHSSHLDHWMARTPAS